MTADEIHDRLLHDPAKMFTPARARKLVSLCERSKVDLSAVLALCPDDVRQQIETVLASRS